MNIEADIAEKLQRVRVRQQMLDQAVSELLESVEKMADESRQQRRNRPIKVKEMATLLEKSESTLWRWGVNEFDTYYQLWEWTRENKPDLLRRLEKNYTEYLTNI